jgi:O-antigen ligase
MSRIDNWLFCWNLALDNPLTGGGFEFQTREVFTRYAPQFVTKYGRVWDTHSIYFAMLATHGFPGFFLFFLADTPT